MIEWFQGLGNCFSSWADMIDACGVQCAIADTLAYVLYPVLQHADCTNAATNAVVTLLVGLCE
jgi:hypothetical protein